MPSLSGTRLCPQRSNSQQVVIKPHPPYRSHCPANARDRSYTTPTSYSPATIRKRPADDDLIPQGLEALQISPVHYSLSNCPGRPSTAASYRHHNNGIAKRQERPTVTPIPSPPHISDVRDVDAHAAIVSQASTTDSAADSVRSCEQDSSSTASSLVSDLNRGITPECVSSNYTWLPNPDANNEAEVQVSASQHANICQANETPRSQPMQQESEGDNDSLSSHEDEVLALAPSLSLRPETEFEANLLAASEDSRHLFLEYYRRTHGDQVTKVESPSEVYWEWDQERQQWYHKEANTQSVVWFLG
ncbi:hypothetical protein F4803DRAFT_547345 [Xylaria telfairii]|nr:hypothetical protein F4803DRAFT_547345 [Xylaria telfairii]